MSQAFIQFQFRRGNGAEWAEANPILAAGEPGLETDNHRFKLGDGVTPWASLPYATGTPMVVLTQAEYDAVTPKPGVLYLIGE